jgi:Integrase core domain
LTPDPRMFNGRLREECLNQHAFASLDDARKRIEAWRTDYNSVRPHSALWQLAPEDGVLFELPISQRWLRQVTLAPALICRSSYRGVVEFNARRAGRVHQCGRGRCWPASMPSRRIATC